MEGAVSLHLASAFNSLVQFIVTVVFLLIFCELPDYITKYVQSTFELFLSQYYLLLSFNKVLKHFPLPVRNAESEPSLC